MYLDVRTMVAILTLGALLSSGGMALLGRQFADQVKGPRRFSRGMLVFVFGWGLLGLRGFVPDFLSVVVANVVLVLSLGVFYQAIRGFQEQAYNNHFIFMVTATVALEQIYFTYVDDSFLMRTILASIAVSLLLLYSAQALLFRQPKPIPASHWLTASGFILVALITLGRAGYEAIPGNALESYFIPAPVQDFTFLGFFFGMIVILFGFVLMIYDKMNARLELLATHDSLTGVYNRRTILELLKVASAGSRRILTSLTVMMIDLDD
ncbi:MAG: GGDEF domain-containing protein, partial [Chloroflexi bacterium]|nr:GGDEF domain-containing protein [Chloroflexota bacterium]